MSTSPMNHPDPALDDDLNAWWATKPQRPPLVLRALRMATITCRACLASIEVAIDYPSLLCPTCRANPDDARAHIVTRRAAIAAVEANGYAAWVQVSTAMDTATSARWDDLRAAHDGALTCIRQLERRDMRSSEPMHTAIADIQQARSALAAIEAKIERTANKPGHPLAPVIRAHRALLAMIAQTNQDMTTLDIAMQEIEMQRDGQPPF